MVGEGQVCIIALGNPDRGDDGAALLAAERLREEAMVVPAGRPGLALLGLLTPDRPCILLDVTVSGAPPGSIHESDLQELDPSVLPDSRLSSHGFGPAETFALARSLGRTLPRGKFMGIEGESFRLGEGLSPRVRSALHGFEERIRVTVRALSETQQIRGS